MIEVSNVFVVDHYLLKISFSNGTTKFVNVLPLIKGPVFEPLKERKFFDLVFFDPDTGSIGWPGDIDLDPDILFQSGVPDQLVKIVQVTQNVTKKIAESKPNISNSNTATTGVGWIVNTGNKIGRIDSKTTGRKTASEASKRLAGSVLSQAKGNKIKGSESNVKHVGPRGRDSALNPRNKKK